MKPFTINIPIYNEEAILAANIRTLINFLDGLKTEYEIIIVSNGSNDRSNEIGLSLQKEFPQLHYFSLPQKGVGLAFKKAVVEAKFNHLISLDIDLSVNFSFIKTANLLLDEYCLVIGSKITGSQNRSMIRTFGSSLFIYLTKLLLGVSCHDFSIGAKGFSKNFVQKNLDRIDNYTVYVLNLIYLAHRSGQRIVEIPINCQDFRHSKFNLFQEALYKFIMLFKITAKSWFK